MGLAWLVQASNTLGLLLQKTISKAKLCDITQWFCENYDSLQIAELAPTPVAGEVSYLPSLLFGTKRVSVGSMNLKYGATMREGGCGGGGVGEG